MERFKGTKSELRLDFEFAKNACEAKWIEIVDNKNRNVADVKGAHCGISDDEMRANALLISKAPEMLEMLIKAREEISAILWDLYGWCDENEGMVKEIDDLIREATKI